MKNRIIIIDDFYGDPDAYVEMVKAKSRETESAGNYAGIMTHDSLMTPEHHQIYQDLTGDKLKPGTRFTGKVRWTTVDDEAKQDIHFDVGDGMLAWASVVYLTKDHPETDGTIFWKHKRTGLEEIPMTQEGIEQYGWHNTDDLKEFLDTDGMDHSLWTRTLTVPYRYNRMVLFRPWLFHSPGPAFGTSVDDARSVQTFFWSLDQ